MATLTSSPSLDSSMTIREWKAAPARFAKERLKYDFRSLSFRGTEKGADQEGCGVTASTQPSSSHFFKGRVSEDFSTHLQITPSQKFVSQARNALPENAKGSFRNPKANKHVCRDKLHTSSRVVGRKEEIATLAAEMKRHSKKMVMVVGPSGSGYVYSNIPS